MILLCTPLNEYLQALAEKITSAQKFYREGSQTKFRGLTK